VPRRGGLTVYIQVPYLEPGHTAPSLETDIWTLLGGSHDPTVTYLEWWHARLSWNLVLWSAGGHNLALDGRTLGLPQPDPSGVRFQSIDLLTTYLPDPSCVGQSHRLGAPCAYQDISGPSSPVQVFVATPEPGWPLAPPLAPPARCLRARPRRMRTWGTSASEGTRPRSARGSSGRLHIGA
jgi:hypothetical protein